MRISGTLLLAAALVQAVPVGAQDAPVVRRTFAFFDRSLTVEVVGDGSGVLHVMRGGRDRVEVTARVEPGTPAFAMARSTRDRLRLSGAGPAQEYVVVVPEDVRLEVLLPETPRPVPAGAEASASYRWPAAAVPGEAYVPEGARNAFIAYPFASAPPVLSIADAGAVASIRVRTGESGFRIGASRPVEVFAGAGATQVHAGSAPVELIVELPAGLREFVLLLNEEPAIRVAGGEVVVECSPATRQVLAGGRQWIDLRPADGRLRCGASR